jgi:hypothetical protein
VPSYPDTGDATDVGVAFWGEIRAPEPSYHLFGWARRIWSKRARTGGREMLMRMVSAWMVGVVLGMPLGPNAVHHQD